MKPKLPWNKYPAGADVELLGGAFHPFVSRVGYRDEWEVGFPNSTKNGGGWLFPVQRAKTIDEACCRFEVWLAYRIRLEGLDTLMEDNDGTEERVNDKQGTH